LPSTAIRINKVVISVGIVIWAGAAIALLVFPSYPRDFNNPVGLALLLGFVIFIGSLSILMSQNWRTTHSERGRTTIGPHTPSSGIPSENTPETEIVVVEAKTRLPPGMMSFEKLPCRIHFTDTISVSGVFSEGIPLDGV